MEQTNHPVMLLVLDGWGYSDSTEFNAIHHARTPTWDRIWREHPNTLIKCSGNDVGLPAGQMGNSEVGHMHIGSGRTIHQDYTRISEQVADNGFIDNDVLSAAFKRAAVSGRAVHILGLLSPGGVHSHEDHIVALMTLGSQLGVKALYVHGFLDGRDTPPQSAADSIKRIEQHGREQGLGRLVSVVGRYYAMDRNNNWDRTALAYNLIVNGEAEYCLPDPLDALSAAYARGENDEFVAATTIRDEAGDPVTVNDGDVIVFANFRADRARQLTAAISDEDFSEFERARPVELDSFITMTDYGEQFDLPIAFPPSDLPNTFGEFIAQRGLRQLRIAETEKYAHVTFFFNGGVENEFEGEDRVLIPSPDVATYDLKPEMSANEVTDALVEALLSKRYDAIICNYANADMVGHTGNFEAAVACIETIDRCLARVLETAASAGVDVLITADHGNAEQMRANGDSDDVSPHTAHTSNLVPLVYIGRAAKLANSGCLSDIAPTMLNLMGIEQPAEMTGHSLIHLQGSEQHAA